MKPEKPFASYKWKSFSVAPTEGLIEPPVFLGVLRALADFEGKAPSDAGLSERMSQVQEETGSSVDLVRTPARNLIRNSGQYWKGTGLLKPKSGLIELTPLGKKLAEGAITQSEFAAIMIQQMVLPNPWTYNEEDKKQWADAELTIRPLALILEIIDHLIAGGAASGYLTPGELARVVIPMAGQKETAELIADYILRFRADESIVKDWPDCTPDANDERMAREFLLFLANFGVLERGAPDDRFNDRYHLEEPIPGMDLEDQSDASIYSDNGNRQEDVVDALTGTGLPAFVTRRRIATTILDRSGQGKFKAAVLRAYSGRCLLTGEIIPEVLEAAHIIPVRYQGSDEVGNGICLRVDIHRLYDSGNLRITADGNIMKTRAVFASPDYLRLPSSLSIPKFVDIGNLRWRDSYL